MSHTCGCRFYLTVFLVAFLILPVFSQEGRGKGRIHGTVVDAGGNPLEGVRIVAESVEYTAVFEATSDSKGRWAMAGLGTGNFRVTVSKEGYGSAAHEMNVSQISRNNPPLEVVLQKAGDSDSQKPVLRDQASVVLFDEANRLYEEKKFSAALAKFEEFAALNPSFYQVNFNIGNCHREAGDLEKALAAYETVFNKASEDVDSGRAKEAQARAKAGMGHIHLLRGEMDRPIQKVLTSL